jgi:Uncharacterized protein, putative amidase
MKLLEAIKGELTSGMVGLLPVGSVEQHGPHLPLGTDSLIAETVARKVEELEEKVLLFPTLYYGCSTEHGALPYVGVSYETLLKVLTEIAESSRRLGLLGLVIVNGHGGNEAVLEVASRKVNFGGKFKVLVVNLQGIGSHLFPGKDLHAGSVETSLVKSVYPDLVKDNLIPKGEMKFKEGVFETITADEGGQDGVVAEGRIYADQERGRKVLEEMIRKTMEAVKRIMMIPGT